LHTAALSASPLACTAGSFTADARALPNSLHLTVLWLVLCNIILGFSFTINLNDFFRQIGTCSLVIYKSCKVIWVSEDLLNEYIGLSWLSSDFKKQYRNDKISHDGHVSLKTGIMA